MKYYHNSKTFGTPQIDLYRNRLQNIRLKWCKQVINICNIKRKTIINDIGCNYFQFYKELKIKNLNNNVDYFGYDIDIKFIKLGLKYYPELKHKYKITNIEKNNPRPCDISIVSAVLEHCKCPDKILNKLINTTRNKIIIRTFLGKVNKREIFKSKLSKPYFLHQFSLSFIKKFLLRKNFYIRVHLDNATNNSAKYKVNDNSKFKRQMFIIEAYKKLPNRSSSINY